MFSGLAVSRRLRQPVAGGWRSAVLSQHPPCRASPAAAFLAQPWPRLSGPWWAALPHSAWKQQGLDGALMCNLYSAASGEPLEAEHPQQSETPDSEAQGRGDRAPGSARFRQVPPVGLEIPATGPAQSPTCWAAPSLGHWSAGPVATSSGSRRQSAASVPDQVTVGRRGRWREGEKEEGRWTGRLILKW